MQQFVSQPVTYQQNSALGIQSLMPQAQSVVPQMGAQTLNLQSVAIPQAQSVVPSVVPQMQSVVPSVVPQVQSVVPSVVPQVQSVVPSVVPGMVAQAPVTPYIQPIGSRHPIEQNHLGMIPGSFNTIGGSPYGRISQITPAVGAGTTNLASTQALGGLDPNAYAQHVEILRNAVQGAGTKEEDIIRVIASTSNQERALIRRLYNQKYNEDLVKRLQSELSGNLQEACIGKKCSKMLLLVILLEIIKNYYLLYYKDKEAMPFNLIWLDVNKMLLIYIKQEKENGVLMKILSSEFSQPDHPLNWL